jgi:lipopolysaccharide transport system ATP-binding protein
MNDVVVTVDSLAKSYLVGHRVAEKTRHNYTALRDVISRGMGNFICKGADVLRGRRIIHGDDMEEFWALKEISFEVRRGQVLGIIGRNGAGKSTLLKVLSRITEPTKGHVRLVGRVASLLEVGTGFHPELTGRENIFLNGAILGMSRNEIRKKFDEIVAFAEVERFLDTPVKRYSSGMYVRLAFAVAAHLEPEILIIDEVLAVGDAFYQKKCIDKMSNIAKSGQTILFVSHNMSAIRNLTTSCIFLHGGKLLAQGGVDECLRRYLNAEQKTALDWGRRAGNGRLRFTDFWIEDDRGKRVGIVESGRSCTLVFRYLNNGCGGGDKVDVGFGLHAPTGERLILLYASHMGCMFSDLPTNGEFRCRLAALPLATGRYSIWPRIEINGIEADYPQKEVGYIDIEELDYYGDGRRMGEHGHGHAYYLVKGHWTAVPSGELSRSELATS